MEMKPNEVTVVLAEATTLAEAAMAVLAKATTLAGAATVAVAEANSTSGGSDGRRQQRR